MIAAAFLAATSLSAQSPADLLAEADDLAVHGKLSKAQPLYLQAETEFRNAGDSRDEMYAKFGILKYNVQLGSYTTSREEVQQLLSTPLVEGDPRLKIRALEILGTIDLNQNTRAALNDWTNLLAIAKATGDAKWENRANGHLGIIAGMNGDVGSAGKALFQAVSKAEQLGDVTGELTLGIWLANGMSSNGLGDGAVRIIDRVEALAKKNGYTDMPLALSIAKVRALSASSNDHGRANAKALLQATLADARREGILGAQTDLLSQAGQMAMDESDYAGAEKSFADQVEVATKASLPSMRADGLLHLSQIYRIQGQGDKAELAIDQGIDAVRNVQESYDLPRFLAEKAEVQVLLGHTKAADVLYEQATNLIEGLLVNAPSSRVKSSMIGSMSEIYLGHFRLAWNHLHDGPKAFRVIESARGRALVDSLGTPEKFGTQVPKSAAEEEIAHLQRTLLHARLNANDTRRVLAQLDEAYDKAFPAEYEGNRKEVGHVERQVSLGAIRRQLRPGEAFVEYVLDAKTSYAMEVTRSGLVIHSLPGRSEIDRLTKKFLSAINRKGDVSADAKALYGSVISPIAREQLTSIIVVPDGPLNAIPFGALVDPKGAYLSQTLTVSVAPSAAVYLALKVRAHTETATKPFLGIAYSPPESKDTLVASSNTRGVFDLRGPHLSPLPFAREEIVTAADTLGTGAVVLNGDDASESKLKAQPLQDFKVIHLAAHAVGNEVEPDRAALVLAAGNATEDGLWQAREIRRTRLDADVIVLSACETGVGHLQGQEGVMNLARAFFTAGAKSVVASLWSVEDRSTATLMDSFYQHLASGMTVSDALRQAQLDFIRDFGEKAQPYLWAGFQVIGDGTRTINVTTNKTIIRSAR
jgi:CHAT domain-containing protein